MFDQLDKEEEIRMVRVKVMIEAAIVEGMRVKMYEES